MATVGDLVVKMTADTSQFERGMSTAAQAGHRANEGTLELGNGALHASYKLEKLTHVGHRAIESIGDRGFGGAVWRLGGGLAHLAGSINPVIGVLTALGGTLAALAIEEWGRKQEEAGKIAVEAMNKYIEKLKEVGNEMTALATKREEVQKALEGPLAGQMQAFGTAQGAIRVHEQTLAAREEERKTLEKRKESLEQGIKPPPTFPGMNPIHRFFAWWDSPSSGTVKATKEQLDKINEAIHESTEAIIKEKQAINEQREAVKKLGEDWDKRTLAEARAKAEKEAQEEKRKTYDKKHSEAAAFIEAVKGPYQKYIEQLEKVAQLRRQGFLLATHEAMISTKMAKDLRAAGEEFMSQFNQPLDNLAKNFDRIEELARQGQITQDELKRGREEIGKKFLEQGKSRMQSVETPAERFKREIGEIQKMRDQGQLSAKDAARLGRKSQQDFLKAGHETPQDNKALLAGTTGAYKAILQAMRGQQEDKQAREQLEALKEQVKNGEKSVTALEQIEKNLKDKTLVIDTI